MDSISRQENGQEYKASVNTPPEVFAGQWAHEVVSAPITIELLPLTKKDLVVHEWGVFGVFNNAQDAESFRNKEWSSLPSFVYRQFPKEHLSSRPGMVNKPVLYFYGAQTPLSLEVNVRFTEGVPVVWWPAVADPVDDPGTKNARPYRGLTWSAWLGRTVPDPKHEWGHYADPKQPPWIQAKDYELPAGCWLQQIRVPDASPLTVIGDVSASPVRHALGKYETERFLYYDGLVPSPDYVRCEKAADTSVTLRNRANFRIPHVFVVDRRNPGKVGFAWLDGKEKTFPGGATVTLPLREIAQGDWPQTGIQQVKQALLDAGLFEAESDALLKIWREGFFESEGLTVFHILPPEEYDRMLPLTIVPAPAGKPTRVGIAWHPHMEREPALVARIDALLRDLDAPAFPKRSAASQALVAMGPFAATILRGELSQNPSPEMRRRIAEIVKQIDAADVQSLSDMGKNGK